MNILITGGKGFIAGRLNEYLKKKITRFLFYLEEKQK